MNNVPVLVLAGGFGTRLQSVLNGLPKPMANINGKPFIYFLIKGYTNRGFNKFIFSLYFQADLLIEYLEVIKKNEFTNCEFEYIIEKSPLGTGGAIIYTVKELKIKNEFIVVNGDTWVESGFEEILKIKGNCVVLIKASNSDRYGFVELASDNSIVSFKEKQLNQGSGYVNAGIYKFQSSIFEELEVKNTSLENNILPLLVNNKQLSALLLDSKFIDIGIPQDYQLFCQQNLK
jgi:D-glycero-alpha-D-manno-heptose 1-phosphate guanylyltransferase